MVGDLSSTHSCRVKTATVHTVPFSWYLKAADGKLHSAAFSKSPIRNRDAAFAVKGAVVVGVSRRRLRVSVPALLGRRVRGFAMTR